MNGLRKKYTDAVATIKGYDEKVKSLFDVELSALGGDKFDGKGGNIQKLQGLLDAAKENNAWDNIEDLKANYKSLGEQIDDILARAKVARSPLSPTATTARWASSIRRLFHSLSLTTALRPTRTTPRRRRRGFGHLQGDQVVA